MFDSNDIKIAKLGEKVLRLKAQKVKNIKSEEIQKIVSNMLSILKK